MAPKRKKSKVDGQEPTNLATPNGDSDQVAQRTGNQESRAQDTAPHTNAAQSETPTRPSPGSSRSTWLWSSKAAPVAQLALESISVAQGATSESSDTNKRPPNSVSKSVRGSRKSIPLAAEATKVHATSDVSRPSFSASSEEKLKEGDEKKSDEAAKMVVEQAQLPPDPVVEDRKSTDTARQSWFGWWSRPDGYASDSDTRKSKKQKLETAEEVASNTPLPGTPANEPADLGMRMASQFEGIGSAKPLEGVEQYGTDVKPGQKSSRGWFGLWSSAQNERAAVGTKKEEDQSTQEPPEITISAEPPNVEIAAKNAASSEADSKKESDRSKPSGWAFWLSDKPKDPAPTPGGTQKQIGELAVADTPSQSNPEVAQFNEQREAQKPTTKADTRRSASLLRPKRGRPEKVKESSAESSSAPSTPAEASPAPSQKPTPSATPPPSRDESEVRNKVNSALPRPNHILPSFRDCFPPAPNPGYMERLTQYLAQSLHIPGSQTSSPSQHVSLSPSPPKIKKAVALGVHGYFPGALLQKVLGQPTGTSIRFANYAATSIKAWCAEHQPEIKDVEIEKVALEGEGYIGDRVATLWKLLLNWLSYLRNADFIFVACHSQGVPVAVMLVAKLIQLGALSSNVRIGICAMAGINLGPFLEYKSRLFSGTALELFEFSSIDSPVSKSYSSGLDTCLRHGVRITFIGSIDDQLVSLESSLHAPLSHPYVARAVFIDGKLHAPNFLTHLLVFALKLRNLGVGDHGLIRELSAPLAGSLVGGEGHSRIYDESAVYRLAVEFALQSTDVERKDKTTGNDGVTAESSSVEITSASVLASSVRSNTAISGIAPIITPYGPPPNNAAPNPFTLPWAVRGMLEEDMVKSDPKMRAELSELVKEFEHCRPTSKVLRDVRWRLEGVSSMQ